ncbi:hypothetical protein CI109_105955 [Kwoniella shandongensis]|uniref:Peptidase C37 domain-containing protein n=1 Tax=Kwoniella shandongensis TaxID=1734106 RepID=A0A5M6BY10_9TREE|nr:uncharacterized protein CI109_003997 [Kwoniella shandongensis]KAA5527738.1 hypothetical protein CI109_003997 [Kwoniella shandongensis]
MMCLKHILIFFLLVPVPAASPFLLALFAAAVFVAVKPCGYCISLLSILFFSSSPNSPFINTPPSLTSTTNITLSSLPLTAPIPNRAWMNFNGGRIWDPSLVGYRELAKALARDKAQSTQARMKSAPQSTSEVEATTEQVEVEQATTVGEKTGSDEGQTGVAQDWKKLLRDTLTLSEVRRDLQRFFETIKHLIISTINPTNQSEMATGSATRVRSIFDQLIRPSTTPSPSVRSAEAQTTRKERRKRPLPPGYVDLSWQGLGFIVDFGWKRSEEGIKWEIEEVLGREWDREEGNKVDEEIVEVPQQLAGEVQELDKEGVINEPAQETVVVEDRTPSFWSRVPLLGSGW